MTAHDGDPAGRDGDLGGLRERAKELRCLYQVISALARREQHPQAVFAAVLEAIPPAWQYPGDATARIEYFGRTHALPGFQDTPWRQRARISAWRTPVGALEVHYKSEKPPAWEGPFLKEERELLDNIALRLGEYLEWKQRELGGERLGAAPEHWRWRQRFAERIAASLDAVRFGVERVYLCGSTELGTAGPGSDIDLIVVSRGDPKQRELLQSWLEGWSLCLAELSFQVDGLPRSGVLDVRFVEAEEAGREIATLARGGSPTRELPLGAGLRPGRP